MVFVLSQLIVQVATARLAIVLVNTFKFKRNIKILLKLSSFVYQITKANNLGGYCFVGSDCTSINCTKNKCACKIYYFISFLITLLKFFNFS